MTFEELGIDRVFIDEARTHIVPAAPEMRNVGGIS